ENGSETAFRARAACSRAPCRSPERLSDFGRQQRGRAEPCERWRFRRRPLLGGLPARCQPTGRQVGATVGLAPHSIGPTNPVLPSFSGERAAGRIPTGSWLTGPCERLSCIYVTVSTVIFQGCLLYRAGEPPRVGTKLVRPAGSPS